MLQCPCFPVSNSMKFKCLAVSLSIHQTSQVRTQSYGNSKEGHLTLTDGAGEGFAEQGSQAG